MDVSAVNNIKGTVKDTAGAMTLGKNDFMKLLTTQLSHQDPLNPVDSKDFTAQLAQFSSLEELSNANSKLSEILDFQKSQQNAMIPGLIGKQVTVSGNATYLKDRADLSYSLSGDAASVKISIFDKTGKLVLLTDLGTQDSGDKTYVWDGKNASGVQMPEDAYTFTVQALDTTGKHVNVSSSSSGLVTGVEFDNDLTYLILDGYSKINLSEIKSIEERRN